MDTIKASENQHKTKKQIEKLKKGLSDAQKSIIEMSSVVKPHQTFPTVQETVQQFQSIRNQKHHDTSTALKKLIKVKNKTRKTKWQKYYLSQVVHKIMFETLLM